MILNHLKPAIDSALSEEVELRAISEREAQVYVPFYFPDGDGLVVHVGSANRQLEVTDNAHTLLHLSYHTDVDRLKDGTRASLFERIRSRHGSRIAMASSSPSPIRSASARPCFLFVQALLEISDLRNLDREIVRSTFREDVERLLTAEFPKIVRQYADPRHDPQAEYPIPYLLNGTSRPPTVFDVGTDDGALRAVAELEAESERVA